MFINSSNTIKSKILQAAIGIDEDYKEYIQRREDYKLLSSEKSCNIINALGR
jgi:hypothetical protein